MSKKVYKYATGQLVPDGAIYLCTVVEEGPAGRFVWHYYEVTEA